MKRHSIQLIILALLAISLVSCGGGDRQSPILPDNTQISQTTAQSSPSTHSLLGYFLIEIDSETGTADITPARQAVDHMNVTGFLENFPCTDCIKISDYNVNFDQTITFKVSITHPFDNPDFTAFDLRGIVMFTGTRHFPGLDIYMPDNNYGDGELLNAHGFTSLYNPSTAGNGIEGWLSGKLAYEFPTDATVNGFMRYISPDPANVRYAVYSGDTVSQTYNIAMPKGPFAFGYAIDASHVTPDVSPVVDPMTDFPPEANCPEPWRITINKIIVGTGMTNNGGSVKLMIDIFDHQGKDETYPVLVECPELFDGTLEAEWIEDGDGFTLYEIEIENENLADPGHYRLMVKSEPVENDLASKPWLDLSAYQSVDIYVKPDFAPGIVTPDFMSRTIGFTSIATGDNYAYLGSKSHVYIFDIFNPLAPSYVSELSFNDDIEKIEIANGIAYIFTDDLTMYDLSQPGEKIPFNDFNWDLLDFTVSGDYLYLVDEDAGIRILDISDPLNIYQVTTIEWPGLSSYSSPEDVLCDGEYLYLYDYPDLAIFDINPAPIGHLVKVLEYPIYVSSMAINDGYLYLGYNKYSTKGIDVIDIDPPESAHGQKITDVGVRSMVFKNDLLFCSLDGLTVYDLQNPLVPIEVLNIPFDWYTYDLEIENNHAFIAGGSRGLFSVDIDPVGTSHVVSQTWPSITSADDFDVRNGILCSDSYIDVYQSLSFFDVSTPELAYIKSSYSEYLNINVIHFVGDYVYCFDDGFHIIDFSSQQFPQLVNSIEKDSNAVEFSDYQNYLLAIFYAQGPYSSGNWLEVYDVSDPVDPVQIDLPDIGGIKHIAVDDGIAVAGTYSYSYYGYKTTNLEIIDFDPIETAEVLATYPDIEVEAVELDWPYAFVVTNNHKFLVYDITTPEDMLTVSDILISHPNDLYLVENNLYVGSSNGLYIYDVTDPESPEMVSSFTDVTYIEKVIVEDNYAYVLGDTSLSRDRVQIIKLW